MVADGHFEKIPSGYDVLVAGCACVDFSSLNAHKPDQKAVLEPFIEGLPGRECYRKAKGGGSRGLRRR